MKNLAFFIVFLLPLISGFAQKTDIKVYDGRILKTQDQVKQKAQEYRRIQKEYHNLLKDRHREYKALKDSLQSADSLDFKLPIDSLKKLSKLQEEYFVYADSIYSLEDLSNLGGTKKLVLDQSVDLIKQKLSGNRYLSQLDRLKNEIGGYRQALRQYRDSLDINDSLDKEEISYMVERRKQELSKEYEGKLESFTSNLINEKSPDLPGGFQSEKLAQFQKAHGYLSKGLEKDAVVKLSKSQSIDHFKNKQEVLEKAKSEVTKLRKKYSEVGDLYDLSTAKKIRSLKEKSFSKRLTYGGIFQLHVDGNTKVDLSPELGYRINRKFEAGIGGTYRLMVATKNIPQAIDDPKVMGLRGFVEHKLVNNFYVHGEYEGLKSSIPQTGDLPTKEWYYSFLAGLERRFNMKGKTHVQAQVLYNFSSKENPFYNSPWVFRVGFNVRGKD